MKMRCVAVLCGAVLSAGAAAQEMTLDQVLSRARTSSVEILAARRRVAEAAARLASRPALRANPELEGAYGPRDGRPADFEVSLRQTLELGGRGGARRDVDRAALAREQAEAAQVERAVLRDVRATFFRGLHAAERVRVARSVEAGAEELRRIARRRHEAGDVAALEVNVASSALARSRAERLAAEATEAMAIADLRALLGLAAEEPLVLSGDLWDARASERSYDVGSLVAGLAERPEIRALQAQLREAEAEIRLARGLSWPDLTPEVRYEQDDGDRIWWAGLSLSLPLFDRGQQFRAAGGARAEGLRAELESRRRGLESHVRGAVAQHGLRLAAVRELAANAETLADSESLARRSYDVGQIGLGELLVLRQETAEARRQWLDSLLELAQLRAELESLTGGSR